MGLKVHHLNCATLCPMGRKLFNGKGKISDRAKLVCHCLLVESTQGLILIDTGLGHRDIHHTKFSDGLFSILVRPQFLPEETALTQIQQLGFKATEVSHIILTHLDPDHAGGIADFPDAKVHVMEAEWLAATQPSSIKEKIRYNPHQWAHNPRWRMHNTLSGEQWYGFNKVSLIDEGLPEIALIPLSGHTQGHCGVAVLSKTGWILHAGDTYLQRSELVNINTSHHNKSSDHVNISSTWLKLFHQLDSVSNQNRIKNLKRIHALMTHQANHIEIFCAHDIDEFHACKQHIPLLVTGH